MFVKNVDSTEQFEASRGGRLFQRVHDTRPVNYFATLQPGNRRIVTHRDSRDNTQNIQTLKEILAEAGF